MVKESCASTIYMKRINNLVMYTDPRNNISRNFKHNNREKKIMSPFQIALLQDAVLILTDIQGHPL